MLRSPWQVMFQGTALSLSYWSLNLLTLVISLFSQETHILNKFSQDFYGKNLRVCMVGYLRPEKDFTSLGNYCIDLNVARHLTSSLIPVSPGFRFIGETNL